MTATPQASGREDFADRQRTGAPALKLRAAGPPGDPETSAGDPPEEGAEEVRGLYRELMEAAYPELRRRAEAGEEGAHRRLQRFLALGERLGVRPPAAVAACGTPQQRQGWGEEGAGCAADGTVVALVAQCLARRRVPSATYRLQFNRDFPFEVARELAPYLHALGVSDCYASPLLQACAGSSHGYDTCDHGRLNPELGGEPGFDDFAAALRERGMGLVLDAVPNHMGIADPRNAWWMDVLENGPSSVYAPFFDIDWRPVNPDLENKVLLPFLDDQYGRVLEAGRIRLTYEEGAFFLRYHEVRLPIAPCTYPAVLEAALDGLAGAPGEGHEHLREYRSILTALRYLPPRAEPAKALVLERDREKEVIKQRIAALCGASPEVRAAVEGAVRSFNGVAGDPRSFDRLDRLIEAQAYRPAFWRVAAEEINYRRFFDVNELAAIRVEAPEVFRPAHQLLFRLLAEGKATGLRIDHPDGLWDPARYFRQLQENFVLSHVRGQLPPGHDTDDLEREVAACLADQLGEGRGPTPAWPLYVVAEKILCEGEPLPQDWAVDGTTGYDFLNAVNGLFVDADGRDAFDRAYQQFVRPPAEFGQLVNSAKKMTMLVSMASEINALGHQLDRIAERNRRHRDFTLGSLTFAIREVIACLRVYRTYITGPEAVALRDRLFVEEAVEGAKRRNPRTAEAVFDFVGDTLLLRNVADFQEADRPKLVEWVMKFQQLTGPVMAKSVEDTVFYTYNRLASLNEVGGSPDRYGVSVEDFHRRNAERLERWPHALLATSTHDTKRSEDVRARLNSLSELPGEWQAALARWGRMNSPRKAVVDDRPAPDRGDEYLLYQTLLGAWPSSPEDRGQRTEDREPGALSSGLAGLRGRVVDYMRKATKEAKVHTSWVNPNTEYDDAVRDFVGGVLDGEAPFLSDFLALQRRVAFFGYFNSLAQVLLKLTCPGVPDFYQGTELWDFSLVDPDNRRPVDYDARREALAELRGRVEEGGGDLRPLAAELLDAVHDGRIKLYLIYRALNFRREHPKLFAEGGYLPLEASGALRDHVCAFARSVGEEAVLVVVPRLVVRLVGGEERPPLGSAVWGHTRLLLPQQLAGRTYRNLFTGESIAAGVNDGPPELSLGQVLGRFPVALLECRGGAPGSVQ